MIIFQVFGFIIYATERGRDSYHKFFCSELVARGLKHIGKLLLERIPTWKISPTMCNYSNLIEFRKTIIIK